MFEQRNLNERYPDDARRQLVSSTQLRGNIAHRTTGGEGLLGYWRVLMRRKGQFAVMVLTGIAAAVIWSALQTPVYQARVSFEVQNFNSEFLDVGKVDPTTVNYEADSYVQTQLKMLQSDSLLDRVVAKLSAGQKIGKDKAGKRVVVSASASRDLGEEESSPRERALAMAIRTLKVRGSGLTRVIEVLCESTDADIAARFVNTLATEFIQQSLEVRWSSAERVTDFLTEQLQGLKNKLETSEDRLNGYTRSAGLVFTSDKANVGEQKFAELQQELFKAQSERVARQSRLEMARNSPPESLPDVLDDPTLREYQMRVADLRRQFAELTAALTPEHPQVKRIEAQLAEMNQAAYRHRTNILARIRNDYETALRREKLIEAECADQARVAADLGSKATRYNILKREVDTTRQLYEGMLQKVKEAGVAAAMRVSNIRVLDTAKPPKAPFRPDRRLNLALGLIGGLFCGTGTAFLRERLDRNIRQPGAIREYLDLPELGLIPAATMEMSGVRSKLIGRSREQDADFPELITWKKQSSLTAESYRNTLTSILLLAQAESRRRPKVLLFTSALPLEGKTTTACNIGIAVAEIVSDRSQKVLLVDADMRRPRLHTIFNVPKSMGLSDLLDTRNDMADDPIQECVRETEIPGLYVLPSGTAQRGISSLVYSHRLAGLISRLRRDFNTVIIDTPPAMSFSESRVLARSADAVILIVRAGHTDRDTALLVAEQLRDDGTNILGTVLTDWKPLPGSPEFAFSKRYMRAHSKYYRSAT